MNKLYKAYKATCVTLGTKPLPEADFTKLLPKDIPGTTLVPVPNKPFTKEQLYTLAIKFGKGRPYSTYIYRNLYDLYTDEELCGTPVGKGAVRFVHIPKTYNVPAATPAKQKQDNPGHVPTVLEAICFWYTLRELGETLDFDSTYIRHFNLQTKSIGGWLGVPLSYVYHGGQPCLDDVVAEVGLEARLVVGYKDSLGTVASASDLGSSLPEKLTINGKVYVAE
jgi:hypothetical protein